jgi:hypothetical protein
MKLFVYKVIFVVICIFFLFNFTIGYQIRKIENKILNISSTEKITKLKVKLKKEMNAALKKDKIFKDEDKLLIKNLIKKVILELELDKSN